jgi:hypothetical protein
MTYLPTNSSIVSPQTASISRDSLIRTGVCEMAMLVATLTNVSY